MTTPKQPVGLGKSGRELWKSIIPAYELRPDEVRVLTDACREADLIAQLEEAQKTAKITAKGSMGQIVISPMISEMRQHRTVLANLLKSLKLPDTPVTAAQKQQKVSDTNRANVRERWKSVEPKGA